MATNRYFNHYRAKNEQNLIEGMVIEAIQQKGIDVRYVKRESGLEDNEILKSVMMENPDNYFHEVSEIEMWPAFVDGFEGMEQFDGWGIDLQQTCTFIASKKRFNDVYGMYRPREGDLIYMPVVDSLLEIKYVKDDSIFFQNGKQYIWEVKCEQFQWSHEKFDVLDDDIIDVLDGLQGSYDTQEVSNDTLEEASEEVIKFDPSNPFGVR